MSSLHREFWRALGRIAGRLASIDTDRLLGTGFALGVFLAVAIVALGGFFPGETGSAVGSLLYLGALLLPGVGALLVVVALRQQMQAGPTDSDPIRSPRPEDGVTEAGSRVGRDRQQQLSVATGRRYRCRSPSTETIRASLSRGAVQRTRTRLGHDEEMASAIVDAGEWTDDPVAAAFLSEGTPYPVTERLRAAVDPGSAYRRRVRRTLDAIQCPEDESAGARSAGDRSADAHVAEGER